MQFLIHIASQIIDASKDETCFGWSLKCLDSYFMENFIGFEIELAKAKFMLKMKLN
jgi:hypothetical protein